MEVFRISKKLYQQDIIGTGAYLAGGRWNTAGNYMIYTAASHSLAILEVLIHISRSKPVNDYSVIALYIPDKLFIDVVDQEELTFTWRNQYNQTQSMGDSWLSSQKSIALKVPSAIVKAEYNFLINPNHPAFQSVKLLNYEPLQFDNQFFAR